MTKNLALRLSAVALLAIPIGTARADLVLSALELQQGQGFGATTTIMTMSIAQGDVETGCFAFGGVKGAYNALDNAAGTGNLCDEGNPDSDIDNPLQPPKNAIVSLSSLGITATNQIGLLLNLNQISNQGITLQDMNLTFYTSTGTVIFNANLPPGWCTIATLCSGADTFLSSINGQGGNGQLFVLNAAQQAALNTAILANGGYGNIVVGAGGLFGCGPAQTANCKQANDGAESIQLANITTPIVTIPEPSTTALMATGLLGLGGVVRRRRRRQS
jgi:hypothetical protein